MQLGAGVPDGVDAASHAMSAMITPAPDAALLTVYMETACNSVDLAAVFAAVQRRCPALLPLQRLWCAHRPAHSWRT
jgi:hypothetical protein